MLIKTYRARLIYLNFIHVHKLIGVEHLTVHEVLECDPQSNNPISSRPNVSDNVNDCSMWTKFVVFLMLCRWSTMEHAGERGV